LEVIELTKKLISIPSATGYEKDIIVFLSDFLKAEGLEVILQPVSKGRANIFAFAEEPSIVFSTHFDTVPGYIPVRETDEYVYGRGSCDAKGIAAAQIAAVLELIRNRQNYAGLLFVAGEERGSDGALKANQIPNRCRYLINGEPTQNKLASGTKGVYRIKISCRGKTAHSAYPESGESAILKLLDNLERIRKKTLPSNTDLGYTTLNIGTINGGITGNVLPDYAQAELMFRATVSVKEIADFLNEFLDQSVHIEVLFSCEPLLLHTLDGFETEFVSFATDLSILDAWGERLLTGPGSILDAHTDDEKICKKQLREAVKIYRNLAVSLNESLL
jgi:acetylornithine deacetylase